YIVGVCFFFQVFFFQAEDGIRDRTVTGVQTCALPIWSLSVPQRLTERTSPVGEPKGSSSPLTAAAFSAAAGCSYAAHLSCRANRSEERRVGKECRSRQSADD